MANGKAKEKGETLIGIGQKMDNQKNFSLKIKEAMLLGIIEESKSALDVAKKVTLKETAWQKMFICIMKRKQMKILI